MNRQNPVVRGGPHYVARDLPKLKPHISLYLSCGSRSDFKEFIWHLMTGRTGEVGKADATEWREASYGMLTGRLLPWKLV